MTGLGQCQLHFRRSRRTSLTKGLFPQTLRLESQPIEREIMAIVDQDYKTMAVADLVQAAQRDDRGAFGELYERFHDHIMAVAMRRLGNYGDAEELCQDVFIQAIEKLAQLRVPECFGGWLRQITHRMAINRIVRRAPVTAVAPEMLAATCLETDTPLSMALGREREEQIRGGLSRLGDLDRETLEAFYIEHQSLREMSDDFEAPLGTIKRRLHVARKRLSAEVDELVAV
jgi:RNA polymerase sigma-70 factor (ECF subfamily)